ncbi:MAG: transglycosylase domain-containing protein [Flavobacteriaceae bacterium]
MLLKNIKTPYFRYGLLALACGLAVTLVFIASVHIGAWGKLPTKNELREFDYQRASEVYSADSVLIGKYYLFDRQPIAYEAFPKHLLDALISIEDERFYKHSGIDYASLLRVGFKTILMQDESSGGGSTLTQQLAKNLYPRKERKETNIVVDKIKEMIIASRLESIFSKDAILTHYLNTVSFGDNTFGIESASLKFFDKRTKLLKVEEAAVLVGMLKATYGYNPRVFPEKSEARRNLVLESMYKNGLLPLEQKDSLCKIPLKLDYRDYESNVGVAPYFREEVRRQLLQWNKVQNDLGHDYNIYTSGLKIYTTLHFKMQHLAEEAMNKHMKELQQNFESGHGKNAPWRTDQMLIEKTVRRSAVYKKLIAAGLDHKTAWDSLSQKRQMTLTDREGDKTVQASTIDSIQHYMKLLNTGSLGIDPRTGAVKTWIGGVDFKNFKYDHISQGKRQVGSTFKPILYTAALESGFSPCSYFSARQVTYRNLEGWSPSNSGDKDETFLNYSIEEALRNSINTVAVKVLEETGIPSVVIQAKKMGITSKLPLLPSLALGTGEIGIEELAGAYASFVNNGRAVQPYLIQGITNHKDSILETFRPHHMNQAAFSERTRQEMLEMMKSTIDLGTAQRIRSTYKLKNDIAGKTGTTQNNRDAWFVAITPKLVHVSWVGLDTYEMGFSNTTIGQGANAALPLYALFQQKLNADPRFDAMTKAKFTRTDPIILKEMNCPPVKRDGFLKRLFTNPNKKKEQRFKNNR